MRKFIYSVYNPKTTQRESGAMEANSLEEAARSLQSTGLMLLKLEEDNPLKLSNLQRIELGGFSAKQKAVVIRQLSIKSLVQTFEFRNKLY